MRSSSALLLFLIVGCTPAQRAWAPTAVGASAAAGMAASGRWEEVDDAADRLERSILGRGTTQHETWIAHAGICVALSGGAALAAWTWDAWTPAAAACLLAYTLREIDDYSKDGPLYDGVLDVVGPALNLTIAAWTIGWPQ